MRSLSDLHGKWWYRLLMILYIAGFLVAVAFAVKLVVTKVGAYQRDHIVVCNYGNRETFFAEKDKNIEIPIGDYTQGLAELPDSVKSEIREACNITEWELNSNLQAIVGGVEGVKPLFEVTRVRVNVNTPWKIVVWIVVVLLAAVIAFGLIKRAFYYIVFGSTKSAGSPPPPQQNSQY